nr:ferredoxin [Nocardia africana]
MQGKPMNISIDRDLCDNHGQCIAVSEGLFDTDDNGVTVLTRTAGPADRPLATLAAHACPALAITVSDE